MIFNMLVILVYPKDAWNVLFDIFGTSDQISGARNDVVDGIDLQQTSSSSQNCLSLAVQSFFCASAASEVAKWVWVKMRYPKIMDG